MPGYEDKFWRENCENFWPGFNRGNSTVCWEGKLWTEETPLFSCWKFTVGVKEGLKPVTSGEDLKFPGDKEGWGYRATLGCWSKNKPEFSGGIAAFPDP